MSICQKFIKNTEEGLWIVTQYVVGIPLRSARVKGKTTGRQGKKLANGRADERYGRGVVRVHNTGALKWSRRSLRFVIATSSELLSGMCGLLSKERVLRRSTSWRFYLCSALQNDRPLFKKIGYDFFVYAVMCTRCVNIDFQDDRDRVARYKHFSYLTVTPPSAPLPTSLSD